MVNYDDKRNYYRMMLNQEVSVTVIDDESNTELLATCRDLSAEGMAIELAHPLEKGTSVRIKVASASDSIQPLDAVGKVVRVKEENKDCYLIGVNISDVD